MQRLGEGVARILVRMARPGGRGRWLVMYAINRQRLDIGDLGAKVREIVAVLRVIEPERKVGGRR